MTQSYINVNGQKVDSNSPHISVFDHGFLFGDSLYEVVRTYDRKPYEWDAHYERLIKSAQLAHMTIAQSKEEIKAAIDDTIHWFYEDQGNQSKEAYARLVITRGIGEIGFGKKYLQTGTQVIVIVHECPEFNQTAFEKGTHLQIVDRVRNDPRALTPAMKSGNYLNSLLAVLEANEDGYDDAILLNYQGHVTEGSRMNLFYVRNGIVATAPLDIGILDGITRKVVFGMLHDMKIPYRETRFSRKHLLGADEVFVSSSIKEVFPVTQIDKTIIGDGKPGALTRKLKKSFILKVKETIQ